MLLNVNNEASYSAALKANLRLVVYDIDTENNTKQILSAKEQSFHRRSTTNELAQLL